MSGPFVNAETCSHGIYEQGWACSKQNDGCGPDQHWTECARIVTSTKFCPICFEEGRLFRLKTDPEVAALPHWCSHCDTYWDDLDDMQADWQTTIKILNKRYAHMVVAA